MSWKRQSLGQKWSERKLTKALCWMLNTFFLQKYGTHRTSQRLQYQEPFSSSWQHARAITFGSAGVDWGLSCFSETALKQQLWWHLLLLYGHACHLLCLVISSQGRHKDLPFFCWCWKHTHVILLHIEQLPNTAMGHMRGWKAPITCRKSPTERWLAVIALFYIYPWRPTRIKLTFQYCKQKKSCSSSASHMCHPLQNLKYNCTPGYAA